MDIPELADALQGLELDNLLFDACYMGSVEVAAEMVGVADRLVASPAEILSTGFPYQTIIRELCKKEPDMHRLVDLYHDYYQGQDNLYQSGTLTSLNLDRMKDLENWSPNPMARIISSGKDCYVTTGKIIIFSSTSAKWPRNAVTSWLRMVIVPWQTYFIHNSPGHGRRARCTPDIPTICWALTYDRHPAFLSMCPMFLTRLLTAITEAVSNGAIGADSGTLTETSY